MKFKKLCLGLLFVSLLTSCNNQIDSSSSISMMDVNEIKDVKTALKYMKEVSNFEVRTHDVTNSKSLYYTAYYNQSYYVGKLKDDESNYKGYILFDEGISEIELVEQADSSLKLYASEIRTASHDLYDNDLTANLSKLDVDAMESGESNTFTSKEDIIAILGICGFSKATYLSLKGFSLTASYTSSNEVEISFAVIQGETTYSYLTTIRNFGSSSYSEIDDFISGGGQPYQVNQDLDTIRNLFYANNYVRNEFFDTGKTRLSEYFTPQYYFNDIKADYIAQYPDLAAYYSGYVYIKKDKLTISGYSELNYDGVFLAYTLERKSIQLVTRENPSKAGYAQEAFLSHQDDLTYVMNYPSNLYLWDHFERFELKDNVYRTEDYDIIGDFIKNFNITSSSSTTMYATSLDLSYTLDSSSHSNSVVELTLNCHDEESNEIIYNMYFTSFGTAYYTPMEDFIDTYNIRM